MLSGLLFAGAALPLGAQQQEGERAEQETAVDEVEVVGQRHRQERPASDRLGLSLLELPRSVSMIDGATLKRQMALNERDVMRNLGGVSQRSQYHGSYSQFMIRGIWANNTYNYLRDGAKFVHLLDPPLFNIERVEAIKGPAALEYGQVAPGGLIHYVSKQPQFETARSVRVDSGRYSRRGVQFDVTGPLARGERLAYRLTGALSRGGNFTRHIDPEKQGLAGALLWQPGERTRVLARIEYHEADTTSWPGLPVPDPADLHSADRLDVRNFYGEPGLTTDGSLRFSAVEVTHRVNDRLDLRLYGSRNETRRDVLLVSPLGPVTDDQVQRTYWLAPGQRYISDTALAELRGDFATGVVAHQWLAGADYRLIEGRWGSSAAPRGPLSPVDLNDPEPSGEAMDLAGREITTNSRARNLGIFLQNRMSAGPFGLLLGLRHDEFRDAKASPVLDFSETQPSVALSWNPVTTWTLYASRAHSFQANTGTRLVGDRAAPPSQGKQWEIGSKKEWLGGRFYTTVAWFELELTNAPVADPESPGFSVLTGRQRVTGWEFEAVGALSEHWQLRSELSLLDPRVASAADHVGNRPASTTRRTASLWTMHELPWWPALWAGVGMTHEGDKYTANDNLWKYPAFTVWDAAIGYRFSHTLRGLEVQANLRNLTDRRYYVDALSGADGFTSVRPGEPRSLYLSAEFAF